MKYLFAVFLFACGSTQTPTGGDPVLTLSSSEAQLATKCDASNACPDGKSCFAFQVEAGTETRCLENTADVCKLVTCSSGECLILESYPAQVRCSKK